MSFEYPTRAGKVLRGINLDIAAGSTVAIVGPSGSGTLGLHHNKQDVSRAVDLPTSPSLPGKSTIIQLLQRFYDPVSGDITLDGQKLPHMNLQWLRQHIGVVSQEPILFRGSIAGAVSLSSRCTLHVNCHCSLARDVAPLPFMQTTSSMDCPQMIHLPTISRLLRKPPSSPTRTASSRLEMAATARWSRARL